MTRVVLIVNSALQMNGLEISNQIDRPEMRRSPPTYEVTGQFNSKADAEQARQMLNEHFGPFMFGRATISEDRQHPPSGPIVEGPPTEK